MKNILTTALLFATVFIGFGQNFDSKPDSVEKKAELFNHFYHHQNLEITNVLDNGIDFDFLQHIKYTNFTTINKSEARQLDTYLIINVFSMDNGIGRIDYTVVNSGKETLNKSVKFSLKDYTFLKI